VPFINDENLVVNTTITTTTITITTKSTTKATEKNDRNYKVQKNLADENVFISKYKFQCYILHRLNFDFLIVPLSFKFIHSLAQVEILFDLRILFFENEMRKIIVYFIEAHSRLKFNCQSINLSNFI